jgi:Xaa-Pro dipeptidase
MELLTKSEVEGRAARLQHRMQSDEIDAAFVLQNADVFYFSGTLQTGLFCLPSSGDPVYLVQRNFTRAQMESPWERILPLTSFKQAPSIFAAEGLGQLKRVGLEMDVLPAGYYLRFKEIFPGVEFLDISQAIRETRMIKSSFEVEQIRRAGQMLGLAFKQIPGWMKPGITELELASRIEGFLRLQGHQGITRMRGFNYEVGLGGPASGPSACYPTCFPGSVGFVGLYPAVPFGASRLSLTMNATLMVDMAGGYGGYIADKTRTFVLGNLAADMREAHDLILDVKAGIESMLKPGTPCSELYRYSVKRVEDSPYAATYLGLEHNQVKFVGHGVGLELDELPLLAPGFDLPLQPGMTIAIEPKIFFPERGGVGIENTYVVTDNGFENLTPFPEEIIPAQG